MRATLVTLAVLVGGGCSVVSSTGLSNGGVVKRPDAGGGTTTGGGAAPGSPCASNGVCSSGVCGLTGSGDCCATACSTADPTCAATGCDDAGACEYAAAGIGCGPSSCSDSVQSDPQCDGYGHCSAEALTYCAYKLLCDDAGAACIPKCSSSADCQKGFKCNAGLCVTPEPVGPCTENDDCTQGYCGVAGTGHCCAGPCSSLAPCGATDCDPNSGVCVYANAGVACGQASCDGGILQPGLQCDGLGACPATQAVSCAPYACVADTNACATSCSSNADCSGGYCDTPSSTCCGVPSGGSLIVDSQFGSDLTACCGSPGGACQTLGHAMQLIDKARARDVSLKLAVPDGGVWAPPGEVYPVVLGWGVELLASQNTFEDGNGGNRALFEIGAVSPNDLVGYASIVNAYIGGDQPNDPSAILVDPGSTLYLADSLVVSSLASENIAIEVSAGAGLVLGRDHSGARTGTVQVSASGSGDEGFDGIFCDSTNNMGCTISDAWQDGGNSVILTMQTHHDIDAQDFASVTLTNNPAIGYNHPVGFGTCFSDDDGLYSGEAILLHGKARMTFDDGMVQCVSGNGFELEASANGLPTLTLNGTVIQNTLIGVHVPAGSATISKSTIQYNSTGVEQDTDGTNTGSIDLSGGDAGGANIVACNAASAGSVGVSVLNTTAKMLNASNVEWDTPGPDVFMCDASLMNCSCQITMCTADAGANGMDAVYESSGTIVTTGNELVPVGCAN